jgi:hypothetical protein
MWNHLVAPGSGTQFPPSRAAGIEHWRIKGEHCKIRPVWPDAPTAEKRRCSARRTSGNSDKLSRILACPPCETSTSRATGTADSFTVAFRPRARCRRLFRFGNSCGNGGDFIAREACVASSSAHAGIRLKHHASPILPPGIDRHINSSGTTQFPELSLQHPFLIHSSSIAAWCRLTLSSSFARNGVAGLVVDIGSERSCFWTSWSAQTTILAASLSMRTPPAIQGSDIANLRNVSPRLYFVRPALHAASASSGVQMNVRSPSTIIGGGILSVRQA